PSSFRSAVAIIQHHSRSRRSGSKPAARKQLGRTRTDQHTYLPPASNWDELEQINTLLFEEARHNRLTAEKFVYNGGHLATGGGTHIVIGRGAVPARPFLRRPGLTR